MERPACITSHLRSCRSMSSKLRDILARLGPRRATTSLNAHERFQAVPLVSSLDPVRFSVGSAQQDCRLPLVPTSTPGVGTSATSATDTRPNLEKCGTPLLQPP